MTQYIEIGLIDTEYWPGPLEYSVLEQFSDLYSVTVIPHISRMGTALNNLGIALNEVAVHTKVPVLTLAPKTGPRHGSKFDRKGRPRW